MLIILQFELSSCGQFFSWTCLAFLTGLQSSDGLTGDGMPNMALGLRPLLGWLEWLRGWSLSFYLVPLPCFCKTWCSQSSKRIKQKIWGLLTFHLKLHRVTCSTLLLIKASCRASPDSRVGGWWGEIRKRLHPLVSRASLWNKDRSNLGSYFILYHSHQI